MPGALQRLGLNILPGTAPLCWRSGHDTGFVISRTLKEPLTWANTTLIAENALRKGKPMKLTTNTNISVDSVMQGLGGWDENPTGGFERGG